MSGRFFLVAGEDSGDQLGAGLMSGIRSFDSGAEFVGVGGARMIRSGLAPLFELNEIAVVGIAEIIPRLPRLFKKIQITADAAAASGADALITIDSPDFSFRVARRVRRARPDLTIIHYVSPSVWAWRAGRAKKMHGIVDLVLTLLPFEPGILQSAGVNAEFVGHPAADIQPPTMREMRHVRRQLGISDKAPLLLALPGSRETEVRRLAPLFGVAAAAFAEHHPQYRVVVPAARPVAALVRSETQGWNCEVHLWLPEYEDGAGADGQKAALFAAADLALAASGTVTLELAAARTPTVVAYDVNWLSRIVISALLRVNSVTLTNILLKRNVVPELLGSRCRPPLILAELNRLCVDRDARAEQIEAFGESMLRLRSPGGASGLAAAAAVIRAINERDLR